MSVEQLSEIKPFELWYHKHLEVPMLVLYVRDTPQFPAIAMYESARDKEVRVIHTDDGFLIRKIRTAGLSDVIYYAQLYMRAVQLVTVKVGTRKWEPTFMEYMEWHYLYGNYENAQYQIANTRPR